eukprot:gene8137-5247_t
MVDCGDLCAQQDYDAGYDPAAVGWGDLPYDHRYDASGCGVADAGPLPCPYTPERHHDTYTPEAYTPEQ